MRRLVTRIAAIAVCAITVSACGGSGGGSFDVGLQKVALDLAFEDQSGAKKLTLGQELGPVPVPSQAAFALTYPDLSKYDFKPRVISYVSPLACPEPARNAVPAELAASSITGPVKTGRYPFKATGTFDLQGPIALKGNLGPYDLRDYANPAYKPASKDAFGQAVSQVWSWDLVQPLGNGNFIRRSFQATDLALQLTAITYHLNGSEVTFKPSPAVKMMALGTDLKEGATWYAGGTDFGSKTSILVNGGIVGRELVRACGVVYDAWKIKNSERIVSLAGTVPFTSFTDDANNPSGADATHQPNYYWVAPQYGGMFLAEEFHTTTSIGATTLLLDGKSTIMTLDPPKITLVNE